MKKFILFLILSSVFCTTFGSGELNNTNTLTGNLNQYENQNITQNVDYNIDLNTEIDKQYKKEISINSDYEINLSNLYENLKIVYPGKDFNFEWNLKGGAKTQNGVIFKRMFNEKGEKELELNIYELSKTKDEKGNEIINTKLLFNKTYTILVFEKSFFLIYSDEIGESDINNYIEFSKNDGVFINKIGPLNKTDTELTSIVNNIDKYEKLGGLKSDFIIIWGSRDFVFNVLSNMNKDLNLVDNQNIKYNIISLSSYNINILGSYLKNFLANKSWINKMFLLNDNSKYLILKQNLIKDLENELNKNNHEYIDINMKKNDLNNMFFISKFINNLSNSGYSTNSIYIFLIIPIILTIIIFFKHFIGLSPIGIVIPLFITLMFLKIGFLLTLILIFFYICLNLFLSLIVSRYNLLYAPKMVFLISINIISFILLLNVGFSLNLISLNLSDVLYFIVFIIISEKMINILISKDLLEYKDSFIYTILISIFCYLVLNLNYVKVLTLSFPEIIIILVPINFLIGIFSGLRITEYFRFKEIIKSIEEE